MNIVLMRNTKLSMKRCFVVIKMMYFESIFSREHFTEEGFDLALLQAVSTNTQETIQNGFLY